MPTLHITTFITAPAPVVFNLSRHIGLHKISQQDYNEEAVSGTTSGLIKKDETVTWKAKHLFKNRIMTVKIKEMNEPVFFEDIMLKGDFKLFIHKHYFKAADNGTIMIDELRFVTPFGLFGKLINHIFLNNYVKTLVQKRNNTIKEYAETNKWEVLLK